VDGSTGEQKRDARRGTPNTSAGYDPAPVTIFAVLEERFGAGDWSRDLREQDGFAAQATFTEALVDEGFIVLGGPIGDGRRVLLTVEAEDQAAVQARLAPDPWIGERLRIARIEPLELLLRRGDNRGGP
jgi:hypothetical protein